MGGGDDGQGTTKRRFDSLVEVVTIDMSETRRDLEQAQSIDF
jgi:hypothetical protein